MDILLYVQEKLRAAGSRRWSAIAKAADCDDWLPRKIVYYKPTTENATGPGVLTIQPLFAYFQAVDRGEKQLPADDNAVPVRPRVSEAPTAFQEKRLPENQGQFIPPSWRRATDKPRA